MKNYLTLFIVLQLAISAQCQQKPITNFKFGADVFIDEYLELIKNKRIGIVTNHTAVLSSGKHLVDSLFKLNGIHISALFGPEHGIRGDNSAGDLIPNQVDEKTGIPIHSLYGKVRKPTQEMLKGIDILIFDIQDVGARFYTYISTLFYVLQAAAENNIPILVLDRPNPITGVYVDGPIRHPDLSSFVGIAPLPIVHGMTIGELAEYFVGEKMIGDHVKVNLTVIKMKNWQRELFYDYFFSGWTNPSPNISSLETAIVYPGTCLVEGINVSEGRGTAKPFLTIGAPYINSKELINELNKYKIKGVEFSAAMFTPKSIPGIASNPKYKDEKCFGVEIKVTNRNELESVKFGIILISVLNQLYPNNLKFRESAFDRLSGDTIIRKQILQGLSAKEIINFYQYDLNNFKKIREKYLLY
ncbi:MAG: DUF1343 domain-containing protein [Ignavibacteriaceae bacterium]|nr:DUF1343 domain-containing protein [Ignavibacteriaceae bacterium]